MVERLELTCGWYELGELVSAMPYHPACVDRLSELRSLAKQYGIWDPKEPTQVAEVSPNEVLVLVSRYNAIKGRLTRLELGLKRLGDDQTKARSRRGYDPLVVQESTHTHLVKLQEQAHEIKNELNQLEVQDQRYGRTRSVLGRIRTNLHRHWTGRLANRVQELNLIAGKSQRDFVKREKRLLRVILPELPPEQLDEAAQQGKADQLIQQVLMSESVRDTVDALEQRHADVLSLEKSVTEIYELFKDLATLVDLQAERIDHIQFNITKARDHVEKGEKELGIAEDYQKKGRKKRCCLLVCCLIILVAILLPILAVTLHNA